MSSSSHRRQTLFFLAAVVLPCSVLLVLSLRMITQERELAEKRLGDERRRIANDVRQQLLVRLERIKFEEASALAAREERARAAPYENPSVVLVARVEEGRPVLPWESDSSGEKARRLLDQAGFAEKVRQGEQQEFGKRDYAKASALYGQALQAAGNSVQAAYARLLLARAKVKSGEKRAAETLYRKLLALPSDVTDEQGVPLSFYAAAGLLQAGAGHRAVLERIQSEAEGWRERTPAAVYLARDVLQTLTQSTPADIATMAKQELETVRARIRLVEQALALQKDFLSLGLGKSLVGDSGNTEPVWVAYGEETWLLSVAPSVGRSPAMMIAIRAEDVFRALEGAGAWPSKRVGRPRIITAGEAKGEPLGTNFPGMELAFTGAAQEALAGEWSLPRSFYLVTVALVLSVTLFAAYLLWRDVRREVRLAEMRSQFVSSVSHELKTPLTAIRMFAETLSMGRGTDPQTQSEYLETIVNETERLTRLLNNVLDFSKIEQGKRIYRLELTCLADVVQAAARAMQYPFTQQGFQFLVEIENGLPAVRADADAIEQAILNLLANAMKYSGESREIELKLQRQGHDAVIRVTDRGVGLPPGEQARIFEKFYRAPTPENLRVPGTGLGLTLVEHIAKAHGGYVEVQSEPGKGSTFSIHLPLEGAA